MAEPWINLLRRIAIKYAGNTWRSGDISLGTGLTATRVSDSEVQLGLADPTTAHAVWDPAPAIIGRQASTSPLALTTKGTGYAVDLVAAGGNARWAINIPFGFKLTEIHALVHPPVHSGLPAIMPILSVYQMSFMASVWTSTLIDALTDPSANVTAYNLPHYISLLGLSVENAAANATSSDVADQTHLEIELTPEASVSSDDLPLIGALYYYEVIS